VSGNRVLITGASGFAGRWLARACAHAGDAVAGVSRSQSWSDGFPGSELEGTCELIALDLRDLDALRDAVRSWAPAVIYHLAALSSVGRSWEDPAGTVPENVATAVNVLEAVRFQAPEARVIWVSSCEVYGSPTVLPIPEHAPLMPANPYAVSKLAGEQLAAIYAEAYGLDIVRARPFSHSGPGQQPTFIVSSLARQAAEGRAAGADEIRITTGNPDTRRDFTDVRDVVRAYRLLGAGAGPTGEVFNVSSGRSVSAAEQVQLLASLLEPIRVEHVVDPARVRAQEVMDLRGDAGRLRTATGWEPTIPFRQTVSDTIDWWERELATERSRSY
jgi:GDP-4-dehydro-6-deoxy-D-mannose reductase